MTQAIQSAQGVVRTVVSYPKKQAQVVVKKESCTDENYKQMIDALEDSGYGGKVILVKNGDS